MGIIQKAPKSFVNRILVGTPSRGLVRMEWVNARYSQTIPTNWSQVDVQQMMSPYIPLGYQVADAENLIALECIKGNFEWMIFIEDDNIIPPNAFVKINEYMLKGDIPIVGGMYFTKSVPPEPLLYRGQGRGHFTDWKLGEKVWVSGLPFGFTLIHGRIIRELWKIAPEYQVNGITTRRVFDTPSNSIFDPDSGGWATNAGTSDLNFCNYIIENKILEKAGFPEIQAKEFPFLVDTSIFVKHIDQNGQIFPISLPQTFVEGKITWREALKQLTQ